jgi:hypothetical protein
MGETEPKLRFDRVEYNVSAEDAAPAVPCANCERGIQGQYWKWRTYLVCDACRDSLAKKFAETQSSGSFAKAVLMGGGVALACGIGYAIFSAVTHFELALITIGIAVVVAKTVRKASGGLSGPRFQVLAVALTYLASTMGYVPFVGVLFPVGPFIEMTAGGLGALLGPLIIFFGLRQAWRLSRGVPVVIEGPFRLGSGKVIASAPERVAEAAPPP